MGVIKFQLLLVNKVEDLHGLDEAINADLLLVVISPCLQESFVAADTAREDTQKAATALYAPTA